MKIVYIHQYFKTPEEGGAIRSYYLAKALVQAGHEVVMITSHHQQDDLLKKIDGIQVHYLAVPYHNALGTRARVKAFIRFAWKAYRLAARFKGADVYYITSTPLTVGLTALTLKYLHGKKYFFEVRDLWPEAPIQMGVITNKYLQKILYGLEKKIYQQAEQIIALSPGMQASVQAKAPHQKVHLIPNLADVDFFQEKTTMENWPEEWAFLKGQFVITYAGTLGAANHLEYLLEIAKHLQQAAETNVSFLIVGEGGRQKFLQEKASQEKLRHVYFHPSVDKFQMRAILAHSQAVYISFLNIPVLETTSPNKFFDGLAAGKLCLVNTKGWLREIVEKNSCGFYADPEKPSDFYQKLQPFLKEARLLSAYQANARKVAEAQFSRHLMEEKFVKLFSQRD